MKLARPNVFHPRIVLASCPQFIGSDGDGGGDDAGLVGALRRRGLHARWMPWDDLRTEKADLVIVRAVTDFAERREEFLAWTTRVPNLLNPPEVVAWNSDMRYLLDLAAAGVPVQPSDAPVQDVETALIFLNGEQSHAVSKSDDGVLGPADPDFELWDIGYGALDAACAQVGMHRTELLYARIDLIGGADGPRLRELELIGPDLGWRQLDGVTRAQQQRRFALGVESACERLGLGPLPHRGP